jgi:hypothetical protein
LVRSEAFRVVLQPFDAEKFTADGIFVVPQGNGSRARKGAPQKRVQWIQPFRQRRAPTASGLLHAHEASCWRNAGDCFFYSKPSRGTNHHSVLISLQAVGVMLFR